VVEPLLVRDPAQVPFLRTQSSSVVGYLQRIQSGMVVVLADPLVLCNGYLDKQDNERLLSDLFGLARTGAAVAVDEYHQLLTFRCSHANGSGMLCGCAPLSWRQTWRMRRAPCSGLLTTRASC